MEISQFYPPSKVISQFGKASARGHIVEISSDEDDGFFDDGQPESSIKILSPSIKRAVTMNSDEEGFRSFATPPGQPPDHMRMKRQKYEHPSEAIEHDRTMEPSPSIDFTKTEPQESTYDDIFSQFTDVMNSFDNPAPSTTVRVTGSTAVDATLQTGNLKELHNNDRWSIVDKGKGKNKKTVAPFYYDPKFELRMYRGPGYEKFPIVLGTVDEHQDICDKWILMEAKKAEYRKSRRACEAELAIYADKLLVTSDSDDDDPVQESKDIVLETDLLHKVRDVFPDIQRAFALTEIRAHIRACYAGGDEEIRIQPNVTDIISHILEGPDYPRQEKVKKCEAASDGTGITIQWRKANIETKVYQKDALCLLAEEFDHVPTHFLHKTLQEKQSLFESYIVIHKLDLEYDTIASRNRPYRRNVNPRIALEKKYMAKDMTSRGTESWRNLVNEVQAAKQQAQRNKLLKLQELERQLYEDTNLKDHKASGDIVQCQCCFDEEIPVNRAVSCQSQDLHWFCFACVLGLAESQIGSMKYEMECMHESGCKADLATTGIRCAIPVKLYEKLGFYQQQADITAACIEGLEQCSFCDFKAICDPPELSSVFQCQNPDCLRISCRKCHGESHLPKSCEEVSVDRKLSARHQVEEARSAAMMRTCPKCQVKIIKEIGCNKMRCKCGCVMCYVCKMDISSRKDGGYGHFNDSGAKCVLYDKEFDRHEAEADQAEIEAIKKVQEENIDIDETLLQIETGPKKAKVAPREDGLGLGWGGRVLPMLQRATNEEIAEMMRRHRERHDFLYQKIAEREQPQMQGLYRAGAMAREARLQAHQIRHANHVDRARGLVDKMDGPNSRMLRKLQHTAPPRVPVPQLADPYYHRDQVNLQPGEFPAYHAEAAIRQATFPEVHQRQQPQLQAPEGMGAANVYGDHLHADDGFHSANLGIQTGQDKGNVEFTATPSHIGSIVNPTPISRQAGHYYARPLHYGHPLHHNAPPPPLPAPRPMYYHMNRPMIWGGLPQNGDYQEIGLGAHGDGAAYHQQQYPEDNMPWNWFGNWNPPAGDLGMFLPGHQQPAQDGQVQPRPGAFF